MIANIDQSLRHIAAGAGMDGGFVIRFQHAGQTNGACFRRLWVQDIDGRQCIGAGEFCLFGMVRIAGNDAATHQQRYANSCRRTIKAALSR